MVLKRMRQVCGCGVVRGKEGGRGVGTHFRGLD